MKKVFTYFLILTSLFIILAPNTFGANGYQPLAPIDGLTTQQKADFVGPPNPDKSQSLPDYLNTLYIFAIGAAVALAIIMVIWGGIEYMMSGSGEGKSGGKERISSALLGLLLALGSYIILSTINRDLLNLDFTIKPLGVEGTPTTGVDLSKSTVTNPPAQDPYTIGTDGTVYYNGAPTDYYSENGIIYDMEGGQPVNNPGYTVDPKTAAAVKPGQGNQSAINAALQAFQQYGTQASNQRYIGIMDYTQPSSAERFYILDRQTGQITSTKAAHGSGSDPNNTGIATQFSNVSDSKKSSLGAFIAKPYYSTSMNKNALQLNGLESINSNAADRGLAIHNSNYVSDDQCGRSSGCIAYPPGLQNQIQTQLSNAFVYSYGGQQ